jgi:D-amino-acid oxidase
MRPERHFLSEFAGGYGAPMTTASPDVLVIGAGISGLSTALALLGSGLHVAVYAADPPHRTTSAAAGALWGAHLVGADDRVGTWAALTLTRLRELAVAADPVSGVREMRGLAAFLTGEPDIPGFAVGLASITRADPAGLPPGYRSGLRYSAPVVAMPVYLDYLTDQVIAGGGLLHFGRPLRDLADAASSSPARVLVNCTGFGARSLTPDADLVPVRGQVVVVANPGLTEFFVGEREGPDEITYFFPHGATAVLGGIEQHGNASIEPDLALAAHIVKTCVAVEPRLAGAAVLAHRVGLRPVRPHVRLESEPLPDGRPVVHNYGHGGAGVTLSWGCALAVRDEVVALLG